MKPYFHFILNPGVNVQAKDKYHKIKLSAFLFLFITPWPVITISLFSLIWIHPDKNILKMHFSIPILDIVRQCFSIYLIYLDVVTDGYSNLRDLCLNCNKHIVRVKLSLGTWGVTTS